MESYMAEVAKILGVEVNEDFECYESSYTYRITEYGLLCNGCYGADSLMMILNGEFTIKRNHWKPRIDGIYYSVAENGALEQNACVWDFIDISLYKLGNCYRTREEAEANRDKWISFYASDEVLEV